MLPMAFKIFLKEESVVLGGVGGALGSCRRKVAYDLFCLLACYVGICSLYFQPRNKVDAGPEV